MSKRENAVIPRAVKLIGCICGAIKIDWAKAHFEIRSCFSCVPPKLNTAIHITRLFPGAHIVNRRK